jgi:long-chain acyl-CoA synthetase
MHDSGSGAQAGRPVSDTSASWPLDLISPHVAATLDALFRERVQRTPQAVAYRSFDAVHGQWRDHCWSEVAARVGQWQAALLGEGLLPGERIAIGLPNGPDWVCVDQAALGRGLVDVTLYMNDRPENVAFLLAHSGARLLVLDSQAQWQSLAPALAAVATLERVVILGPVDAGSDPLLVSATQWLPPGEHALRESRNAPDDLATLVYTSGTTGRPKGVMLSHRNILSVAHAVLQQVSAYPQDVFLSFLPLAHLFERTVGYYLPMMAGSTVAHARGVLQLAEDLQTVRPTALIAVPRVFETVHARLQRELQRSGWLARSIFSLAVQAGWQYDHYRQGKRRWPVTALLWPVLSRHVASRLRDRLGGHLRLAVSGGAPLPPAIARTFIGLGLPLLQGYGLTEASPVVSANRLEDNEPASVGVPLPGIDVRLGADDEILVRGPNVMKGYWQNPSATATTIDAEGWLHTNDRGRIDPAGRLYITGRLNEIIVLSNGEKVSPEDLEMAIRLDPWVEQCMVVGAGQPFLAVLVVLAHGPWVEFTKAHDLDPEDPASLAHPVLLRTLLKHFHARLSAFPKYARIRRVHVLRESWTPENGLLTPTLKIRRKLLQQRYADAISAIYDRPT